MTKKTTYLVFDTETTGLPADYKAHPTTWPRIVEIAWGVFTEGEDGINSIDTGVVESHLIKPDGWEIDASMYCYDKGYRQELSMENGSPIKDVMEKFVQARLNADYIIGHNLSFDSKIVRGELMRLGMEPVFTSIKICTMMKSTKFCGLTKANGKGIKWPTLEELFNILFEVKLRDNHRAGKDVQATAECFFELKRKGVITL